MGACQSNANKPSRSQHAPISRSFKHKPMHQWTENDVYSWLSYVMKGKLSSLAPIFKKYHIDGKKLINLSKDDLREMQISEKMLNRVLLLRDSQLKREEPPRPGLSGPGRDSGKTGCGVLKPIDGIQTLPNTGNHKSESLPLSTDSIKHTVSTNSHQQPQYTKSVPQQHASHSPLDKCVLQEMEQVAEESATDIIHPEPDDILVHTNNTNGGANNQSRTNGQTQNTQSAQQQQQTNYNGGRRSNASGSGGSHRGNNGSGGGGNGGGGGRRGGGGGGDKRKDDDWSKPMHVDSDEDDEEEDEEEEEIDDEKEREYSMSRSSLNPNASSFLEPIDEGAEQRALVYDLRTLMKELMQYTKHVNNKEAPVRMDVVEEKLRSMQRLISKSPANSLSAQTVITFNTPQSLRHISFNTPASSSNGVAHKRNAKKKKGHHRQMHCEYSYEPVFGHRGKQNFQIPRQLTKEKIGSTAVERIADCCYEYVDKTIAMQMYDDYMFNNGELCVIHLDLHSHSEHNENSNSNQEQQALYLIARAIIDTEKNRGHKWKMDNRLYLERDITDKHMIPKSSRKCTNFAHQLESKAHIQATLRNPKSLITTTKWHKLPVFNKKNNKIRVTVSITKTEFMSKLRSVYQSKCSETTPVLFPIVIFNNTSNAKTKPKYEIHYVHVIKLQDDSVQMTQHIGISYHYNPHNKKVNVSGIHVDAEQLHIQHALAVPEHMTECQCLREFESKVTHFHIGNPDDDVNKIKSMSKTIEQQKQQIAAMKRRMDHEAFMEAQNIPTPSVTPSLTSCSNSFLSETVSNYGDESGAPHELLIEQAYHTKSSQLSAAGHHKNNSSIISNLMSPFDDSQ